MPYDVELWCEPGNGGAWDVQMVKCVYPTGDELWHEDMKTEVRLLRSFSVEAEARAYAQDLAVTFGWGPLDRGMWMVKDGSTR